MKPEPEHPKLRAGPGGHSPSLRVDHDGSGLVVLSSQHHADSAAVRPGDVDDVGDLAGPVDEAAVDVDAQVVQLQTLTGSGQRARHHRHALTGREQRDAAGQTHTGSLNSLCSEATGETSCGN